MHVVYRPACGQDLEKCDGLVVASINGLTERHGFGRMAAVRPPVFQQFSLRDDPAGLWVAQADDQILGFAFSWVSDDLWFLAQLFVSPGQQGLGIGHELMTRTLAHAKERAARHQALITFTFNRVSQGLYIRHGLFPQFPIYGFEVASDLLKDRLQPPRLATEPIEPSASHRQSLAHIDLRTLGISRDKHHRFLAGDGTMNGVFLRDGNERIGYAYISPGGHIGPFAVARPALLGPAFGTALHCAADSGAAKISAFIPGRSAVMLGMALEHGMRITFPMLLMSADEFGDWSRYLPRNPGFM